MPRGDSGAEAGGIDVVGRTMVGGGGLRALAVMRPRGPPLLYLPERTLVCMATKATYPVRVEARLDPSLSRWLWLVKWLLVIPHFVAW